MTYDIIKQEVKSEAIAIYASELMKTLFFEQSRQQDGMREANNE
jgi:hypothetical protein